MKPGFDAQQSRRRRAYARYASYDAFAKRLVVKVIPKERTDSAHSRVELYVMFHAPAILLGTIIIVGGPIGLMLYGQWAKNEMVETIGISSMAALACVCFVTIIVTLVLSLKKVMANAGSESSANNDTYDFVRWDERRQGEYRPDTHHKEP